MQKLFCCVLATFWTILEIFIITRCSQKNDESSSQCPWIIITTIIVNGTEWMNTHSLGWFINISNAPYQRRMVVAWGGKITVIIIMSNHLKKLRSFLANIQALRWFIRAGNSNEIYCDPKKKMYILYFTDDEYVIGNVIILK